MLFEQIGKAQLKCTWLPLLVYELYRGKFVKVVWKSVLCATARLDPTAYGSLDILGKWSL